MSEYGLRVEVAEQESQENARRAIEAGLEAVKERFGDKAEALLEGVQIVIGDGLTESGGEADHDSRTIILDSEKNRMSLVDAEAQLVEQGFLNPGDWTKALPDVKDKPWSLVQYNVVHELGHLLGVSLPKQFAPTRYGLEQENEAFAEAFAHIVYGAPIDPEAEVCVRAVIESKGKVDDL